MTNSRPHYEQDVNVCKLLLTKLQSQLLEPFPKSRKSTSNVIVGNGEKRDRSWVSDDAQMYGNYMLEFYTTLSCRLVLCLY